MEHLTLKAQTTEVDTELGIFSALVSGWTEDREGDTILPTAFDRTVEAWQRSQKRLPLLFEHSTTAVGAIFPESMHTTEEGLVVSGEVDRSTDEGRQVWRMIKNSTASFSIGFMSESRKREGGGREIYEIDLLEISATATPAHAATRVVSWKSAAATTTLTEEETALLEASRAEYKAARAAEAAAPQEEESTYSAPVPPTRLVCTGNFRWTKVRADEPGGATDEQILAHERELRREHAQREATRRAREARAEQEPPTASYCGLRVREGGVIVE